MTTVENLEKELEVQFNLLSLSSNDVPKVISKGKQRDLERALQRFDDRYEKIRDLKDQIQELKLQHNVTVEEVQHWGEELDKRIESSEGPMNDLTGFMESSKEEGEKKEKEKEQEVNQQRRKERQEEEIRLEEIKLKMRVETERKIQSENAKISKDAEIKVKLPKLKISRFQGTHLDWLRFWSQFEHEIDQSNFDPVTKFSHLKELLIPSVRLMIDGLPFTTEGYTRAKTVLKTKYGRPSEVANAHIQSIMALQTIYNVNVRKVHEFYEKLSTSVQSLETMGWLKEINGYVRLTLDKLPAIRADLVRLDDKWQEWKFPQLIEALRTWTDRNPVSSPAEHAQNRFSEKQRRPRETLLQTKQRDFKQRSCVYCDSVEHKSADCDKVMQIEERRRILRDKKLCFNCTGRQHRAAECTSKQSCLRCEKRHHTSVCDKRATPLLTTEEAKVIYPVVVVEVEGTRCRALLDTGAGSSYASSTLLNTINSKPSRTESRRIDMMMASTNRKLEIHNITLSNLQHQFKMNCEVTKVEKDVLLTVPNPRYSEIIKQYNHLTEVKMNETDTKPELPIHMVLGACDYSKIKMEVKPKIGQPGEPIAEKTLLGWTIISPGKESDLTKLLLTRSSEADYERLCSLDVLGLAEETEMENNILADFKEQVSQNEGGWYETALLWKKNHPELPSNKSGSLGRLRNLLLKLRRDPELFNKYNEIIEEQFEEGIVEEANNSPTGKEYYIPHKAVVRENAESTKVRIVYDASAREHTNAPSLNDCLETGPPLQNQIWSVLTRNRLKPIAICGDIKQAFLQIHIREQDRDSLRFHWIKDRDPNNIVTLRFTRAVFGLTQSPFFLGATIDHHLNTRQGYSDEIIREIKDDLYIDDLIGGGATITEAQVLKSQAKKIFKEANFILHKWHSNVPALENHDQDERQALEITYAKEQLNTKPNESKILGLLWNKENDTLSINFNQEGSNKPTKRNILSHLAAIYDPLGFAGPLVLVGKNIYREACEQKLKWDESLPPELLRKWRKWKECLPEKFTVPRSLVPININVQEIHLHAFGDASLDGTSAAVYVVIFHETGSCQGLITAKSRLSKRASTIPRLELISAHMAANLIENVKSALKHPAVTNLYCWSDSTTVLYWLKTLSPLKQFVSNRVEKIKSKTQIQWRHVPSASNPADIGSRGCLQQNLPQMWLKGPVWLPVQEKWPENITAQSSAESEKEVKQIKEIFATTVQRKSSIKVLQNLLEKFSLQKYLRVRAWISRFISNCRKGNIQGPLTIMEVTTQEKISIKETQDDYVETSEFEKDKDVLNLQQNEERIYECYGRIQGSYPLYIPSTSILAKKIIEDSHGKTLHGGVSQTMTYVRRNYWIPKLRKLTKSCIKQCHNCKRYRAVAYAQPPPGVLPKSRTEGFRAFQVIGTDYAGPILYRKKKKECKAYILLFSCSLSRAIHIELVPDITTSEFIKSFKRFIARRGRPEKVYSDNAKTFKAAAKWLQGVMKSEELQNFLTREKIHWQFNLSRAPWWGGQFERLIGLIKQSFYRTIGRATLQWGELEEILIDVEQSLNNRPLSYVEDDIELPILTPHGLIHGGENYVPEVTDFHQINDKELRKRQKYIKSCKNAMWKRWSTEYLKGLRERHNLKHNKKINVINVGDVVLIKGESKNRGTWNMGIVTELFSAKDGIVRAVKLKSGKTSLERPIQHLYPLELQCDIRKPVREILDVNAQEFRPKRNASAIARLKMKFATEDDTFSS